MSESYNPKFTLLLKEIDLIHGTIKNLDDIIYKTKNFCLLFWGGSLYLLPKLHQTIPQQIPTLIMLTAIIPALFWTMNYVWHKHLRRAAIREKIISLFINSPEFEEWLNEENHSVKFPLYDQVGRIYTIKDKKKFKFDEKFLVDYKWKNKIKVFFFKDAKVYYPTMIAISLIFGYFYPVSSGAGVSAYFNF